MKLEEIFVRAQHIRLCIANSKDRRAATSQIPLNVFTYSLYPQTTLLHSSKVNIRNK